MCAYVTGAVQATWAGVVAMQLAVVPGPELSSAVSADEYSSGEAAGEKAEQNDDDNIKSQEVGDVFRTFLFRYFKY